MNAMRTYKEIFSKTHPIIDVAMPMPRSEIMFWKIPLHKYVHIYAYIWEKLFSKTQSLKLGLELQAHFLEWRLKRFGKELFNYTYYYSSICPVTEWPSSPLPSWWGNIFRCHPTPPGTTYTYVYTLAWEM